MPDATERNRIRELRKAVEQKRPREGPHPSPPGRRRGRAPKRPLPPLSSPTPAPPASPSLPLSFSPSSARRFVDQVNTALADPPRRELLEDHELRRLEVISARLTRRLQEAPP